MKPTSKNKKQKPSWVPIRRRFKCGDTVYDTLCRKRFFMPKASYRKVGARDWRGSVEGEYISKKAVFPWLKEKSRNCYQSTLRLCRMVLIEKSC